MPADGGTPARVPIEGGDPCSISALQALPSGELLLSCGAPGEPGTPRVEVLSSDLKSRRVAFKGAAAAVVVDDIVLLADGGALRASRFRSGSFDLTGPAVSVELAQPMPLGRSVIREASPAAVLSQAAFRERSGSWTPLPIDTRFVRWPRLSPDGRRIALSMDGAIRVFDLARGVSWPMHGSTEPVWTPDGRSVIMSLGAGTGQGLLLVREAAEGSGRLDTLRRVSPPSDMWPTDVSRDGRWLAFYGAVPDSAAGPARVDNSDVQFLEIATGRHTRMPIPGFQRGARFSPDGRWVAYTSSETGPNEVYLCAWPTLDRRTKVSVDGGDEPVWAHRGDTLFFRHRDDIMAVSVSDVGGAIATARPQRYFAGGQLRDRFGDQSYDLAPDGRFLMVRVPPRAGRAVVLQLELDWIEDVRARLDRAAREGGR